MEGSSSATIPSKVDECVADDDVLVADDSRANEIGESNDSDNKSVTSAASDDSEMEPFSDYLPKIEQLLRDFGLDGFSVEPLHHGYSYQNCVYALTNQENDKEQYVLRVPNCPDMWQTDTCQAIINDACLLEYLADRLPVPRVKAYCATRDNALKTPFTVQTRLPGQSLENVYEDLNYAEKLSIVDQVVELLASIETVRFATAGTFTASPELPKEMHNFFVTAAPTIRLFDEGDEEFIKDQRCLQDRAGPDIKALLISHINGFIEKESKEAFSGTHRTDRLRPLLSMIEELDHEGSFKDGLYPVVLHHWDLEPRNIMVENSSGEWKICGVIDWDDALSVPQPLARRPPAWLWEPDCEEVTGYLDNDHDPCSNLPEENMAIKTHFDAKAAAALPNYLEDAYGRGRWLRRIWTYARNEIRQPHLLDRADQLRKEWDERPKPIVEKTEAMMSQPDKPKGLWKKSLAWLSLRYRALQ